MHAGVRRAGIHYSHHVPVFTESVHLCKFLSVPHFRNVRRCVSSKDNSKGCFFGRKCGRIGSLQMRTECATQLELLV